MTHDQIIEHLAHHRDAKGLTLQDITNTTGIPKAALSRILSGAKGCTLETACKIANSIGTPLSLKSTRSRT